MVRALANAVALTWTTDATIATYRAVAVTFFPAMHHRSVAPRRHGRGVRAHRNVCAASSVGVPKATCSALVMPPGQVCTPNGGHQVNTLTNQG
eukprot:8958719-Alexandrium_andersonii.AAC.1